MEILSLTIIGAVVSVIVQFLKNKYGTNTQGTLTAVILLSIFAGIGYYIIEQHELLPIVLQILAFAGAIYTFIIKRFE
ncbi:MAG TPA: hypothetical protein DDY21_00165 [Candidatus Moranbacteria bacterium]|nr:hypothetical protein [Candidatus Moranbacteria bacterium]